MVGVRRFPDVQTELVTYLATLAGGAPHAGIRTPTNFTGLLPFVRARRRGGPSDRLNDHATVDIEVFDALYTDAELLAEQVRQNLVGPPPAIHRFDRVECVTAPTEVLWGDGSVRRFAATYTITCRRVTA